MRRFLPLFLLLVPVVAMAGEAAVKTITASSTQKADVGVNYEPENMLEPTGFVYWAEGDGSAGLGTRIDVKFASTLELTGFALWNGSQSDAETFKNSNRVKTMEFEFKAGTFGDAIKETVELKDNKERTVYTFKEHRKADQLKMYIREVFNGEAFNETAISHIKFLTAGGESLVYATGVTSSSEADGYPASAVIDGLVDTPWCVKEGKGKGESIEITLPEGTKLQRISGFFGVNIESEWDKNARPKAVKVEIGDKKLDWALEDTRDEQKLELGGVEATTLKITLGAVMKGRAYKDACVSEIRFETE